LCPQCFLYSEFYQNYFSLTREKAKMKKENSKFIMNFHAKKQTTFNTISGTDF